MNHAYISISPQCHNYSPTWSECRLRLIDGLGKRSIAMFVAVHTMWVEATYLAVVPPAWDHSTIVAAMPTAWVKTRGQNGAGRVGQSKRSHSNGHSCTHNVGQSKNSQ